MKRYIYINYSSCRPIIVGSYSHAHLKIYNINHLAGFDGHSFCKSIDVYSILSTRLAGCKVPNILFPNDKSRAKILNVGYFLGINQAIIASA